MSLLAIDHELQTLTVIKDALSGDGLAIATATDATEGLELFRRIRPQIVLVDSAMPGVLEAILTLDPGTDVIVMANQLSTEQKVDTIQKGAADCFNKPLSREKLRHSISALMSEAEVRSKTRQLDHELLNTCQFEGIIGRSPNMLDVFAKIRRVAPHFQTVLVSGATGTGKELVARALHRLSPVSSNPFVVCNCSAIVESLIESELFGYVKGAFTGASQDRIGVFEYANRGTVFLDEIGELPFKAQGKLLRVLQNHEIQRVGSAVLRSLEVRVIAATNRDLRSMVRDGGFREDLFYRLGVVEIHVPRLTERLSDLPLLQTYFVRKFAAQYKKPVTGMTRRAQTRLGEHSWPGNIRELENVIGHACMMAEGTVVDIKDLPHSLHGRVGDITEQDERMISLDELQKRYTMSVLEHVGGNKAQAAEILGISRATIYQFLAQQRAKTF